MEKEPEAMENISERKLETIRLMLSKRKASVDFDVINPAPERYIARCRISDQAGRNVLVVADSDTTGPEYGPCLTARNRVCCRALDDAFTGYMSELTKDINEILRENGFRELDETIDILNDAVNRVLSKSMEGENYGLALRIGNKVNINLLISTQEAGRFDVHMWSRDGALLFCETGLCADRAGPEGYAQWIYAVCENMILTENRKMLKRQLEAQNGRDGEGPVTEMER